MPYKNMQDRRAASKRHYELHKSSYIERNKRYRYEITQFVNELKSTTPCADCNMFYPPYVMDFDHLDRFNKLGIVSYFTKTGRIAALKKEITKCEIVCSNCHRKRTHNRLLENSPDS